MNNCPDTLKKLVPLSRVASAAIVDLWEDIGKSQQLAFHWGARGLKKLQSETLKGGNRYCLITVNPNTRTATLPADFEIETFVGYIKNGEKIPIPLRTNLVNVNSIDTIECEDKCEKCGQNAGICNDLTVTETEEVVVVGSQTAVKTTIKKLYPDGSYYLETTIPYQRSPTDTTIDYATTKTFIASIDLLDCGCPNPSTENIATIRDCCYDAYCCHYSGCSSVCDKDAGGYKIFEEAGLIQFDYKFNKTQVYLEYRGFIPKLNGQFAVPEIAFETLVEYIKAMWVDGKRNVSINEKAYRWGRYSIERKAMVKKMSRFSLDDIIYIISLTPKFDWTAPSWNNFCPVATETVTIDNSNICDSSATYCSPSGNTPKLTPFKIAVIVPATETDQLPVPGTTTWQCNALIGAVNVEWIIVNEMNESKNLGKFTFDSTTGIIDRSPNQFFEGDSIIVDFSKMV